MSYKDFKELPDLINDRLLLDEHSDTVEAAVSHFLLSGDQETMLMEIENKILFQQAELADFPQLIIEALGLDQKKALQLAVDRWGNYFFLFQDFLGKVSDLITQNGGNILQYQERAQKLLSPHRQLRIFIREAVDSTAFQDAREEIEGILIDAVLDRAREKIYEPEFLTRVQAAAGGDYGAAEKFVNDIESLLRGEIISRQWAEYYVNLLSNVINAIPGNFIDPSQRQSKDETASRSDSMMFLLQQFEKLPDEVKKHFTSESVGLKREEIEKKFGLNLENIVFKAAAKEFPLSELAIRIRKEFSLSPEVASQVRDEVVSKIFAPVMKYYSEQIEADLNREEGRSMKQEVSATPVGMPNPNPQAESSKLDARSSLPAVQGSPLTQDEYANIARGIIAASGANFDVSGRERLEKMIVTRIRNVRNAVTTKEKMLESALTGGAGISVDSADILLKFAGRAADLVAKGSFDDARKEFPAPKKTEAIQEVRSMKQEVDPPKLAIEEIDGLPVFTGMPALVRNTQPPPSPLVPLPLASGAVSFQREVKIPSPFSATAPTVNREPNTVHRSIEIPVTVRAAAPTMPAVKAQVLDVKAPPRLIDAVEELRIMTLKDFRRLSADPKEAIKRISQKVAHLEKESISKKMEGIQAWKASDVQKLYVQMSLDSFGKGLPLQNVISERTAAGKDAFTESEFDALVDLNESLRV